MFLTIKQLSYLLHYTPQGTRLLVSRLSLPMIRKGKIWLFDTSNNHPFALSIRLNYQQPRLHILYSMSHLSQLLGKHQKTILQLLIENDIPIHGTHKKYVYLWDFQQLRKKLGI